MNHKYLIAIGLAIGAFWLYRHSQMGKALADATTSTPPADGFAGPEASAVAEQATPQNNILSQRIFSPPASGTMRYGNQANGGMNVRPDGPLAPPGSYRSRRF